MPVFSTDFAWYTPCSPKPLMIEAFAKETTCLHCGLHFMSNRSQSFCCSGCEFVFGLIHVEGLDQYYKIKEANPPACPVPAQTSSASYEYCDDPEFVKKSSPDSLHLRFYLEGLNCSACLWLLEKLPDFCSDAESARVNMGNSTIEVRRRPGGSFAKIAQTLNRFGYRPHPLKESDSTNQLQIKERRQDLVRIGVAAAATGNIMILAVSLYGGATGELAEQFRWLSAILALPVLTFSAWPFYKNTILFFKSGRLNIDVPIVAALVAGIAISLWSLSTQKEVVYFDSLSMLVLLLLSSRFFLKGIQRQHLQASGLEDELLLSSVQKIGLDGQLEKVSSLQLMAGDLIQIDAESIVPADGILISEKAWIDRSVMTGESEPVALNRDQKIEAGSRNLSFGFQMKIENPPAQTRLAQILRDTERSAQEKSSFVHFSDRISYFFITLVLGIAAVVFFVHFSTQPLEGMSRALALIIVTCPCVFGMAIPLSMSFAIRKSAQRGIIVKNADVIERLWKIKTLFFDKTGTLSQGKMSVLRVEAQDPHFLEIALGLEREQNHPVGRAITQSLSSQGIAAQKMENIRALPEGGITGFLQDQVYSLKPILRNESQNSNKDLILSHFGLFQDQQLVASFELGDQVRPESASLIQWLKKNRYDVQMISGDKAPVVNNFAKALGLSVEQFQAEVTPEQKAQILKNTTAGRAMVGDGANDAAALAVADIGIAVCGSLDVSLRAADVYLVRTDLMLITELFQIAKLTRSAIFRNLFFSASFNLIAGSLAIMGLMTPLWAAVLMPVSSLTVLLSSLWTQRQFPQNQGSRP